MSTSQWSWACFDQKSRCCHSPFDIFWPFQFWVNIPNCASWTSLMRLVVQQAIDDVKGWGRPKVMDDFSWAWQTWNLSTVISSHPRRSFWNKFMLRLGRAYFQQKQDWRPNHYPFHYELESSVPNFVYWSTEFLPFSIVFQKTVLRNAKVD